MFRKYLTFEANREAEYIQVFYSEWVEANGIKLSQKTKCYWVKDLPQVSHIVPGDPNASPPTADTTVIDSPAYPMFTDWFAKIIIAAWVGAQLGADIIVTSINTTLTNLPFDVPTDYNVTQ